MRLLHLDSGSTMRGGQYQVLNLIEQLAALGVEQMLAAPAHSPLRDRVSIPIVSSRASADIVHAHDARSHTLAVWRKRLVVSRRVAFPVQSNIFSRWKYSQPERFLAVSEYVAERLYEAGVPKQKVRIVYDGVLPLPLSTRTGPIIAPATSDPRKGPDLIRAAGVPVEFVTDLPKALETARAMLYISREEGLGSAALLAMSAGVPVIASNVGGLREIVSDGETGVLTAHTPDAIRAACQRDLGGFGDRAREVVQRRFLARHMAAATLDVYRELLS